MRQPVVDIARVALIALLSLPWGAGPATAQTQVDRTRDRGEGQPISMLGTYVKRGELLVYPFYEYYWDHNFEYKPEELGFVDATDFRGKYRANEGLVLVAYGISERFALEFEVAGIAASLDKSPLDGSAMPSRLEQSGLGDVEGQLRWRWSRETDARPEYFGYFETVFPSQRAQTLIGTRDWEFKFGTGLVRGLSWGTITVRGSVAHSAGVFEVGEYAFEYLRRLSSRLRLVGSFEGTEDELALIGEAQVFLTPNIFVKLNNAFGVTSKAIDFAPEVGVMMVFPLR
jgi:hypothetical protein